MKTIMDNLNIDFLRMVTTLMMALTTISAEICASIPKEKIFRTCCSLTNLISLLRT